MKRGEDTKRRIARAALKLFVRKGIAETTTREIALGAGVAEGTIYRHFESKEDLAWILFRDQHLGLALAIDTAQARAPDLRAKIEAIIGTYCRLADTDSLLFSYHLLAMHAHLERISGDIKTPVGVVRGVVSAAMAAGETEADDVDMVTAMVMGVVLQPAIHKVYGHIDGPLSDYSAQMSAAAWSIVAAKG